MKKIICVLIAILIVSTAMPAMAKDPISAIVKIWANQQKEKARKNKEAYRKYEQKYDHERDIKINLRKDNIMKKEYWKDRSKKPDTIEKYEAEIEQLKKEIEELESNKDFKLFPEWLQEHEQKEKEELIATRKKYGFWKYWGSKLFGKWVLYTDSMFQDPRIEFLHIGNAPDEEIEELYNICRPYMTEMERAAPDKKIALLQFTYDDFRRRNMSLPQKVFWDLAYSCEKVQSIGIDGVPVTIPINVR